MSTRTEELLKKGARDRGGGTGSPFLKWGEDYAWVEGEILRTFDTKFGPAVTMYLTAASEGLDSHGKDEDGKPYHKEVTGGMEIALGLNHKALEGRITDADKGKFFHVAFEGWRDSKDGKSRYRNFQVLEIPPEEQGEREPERDEEPSDGLPF